MSSGGQSQPQAPALTPSSRLIATLGGIALFAGVLVVSVVEWTRPMIAANQEQALEEAVLEVLPGATERQVYVLTDDGPVPAAEAAADGPVVHAGYDEHGQFIGVALEGSERGYADVIRILYGYDPQNERILGMSVLESKETPGLGDRIETDSRFLSSIEGLDASLNEAGTDLAHRIRTVEAGEAEAPGEIDGITGATISAEAVGEALHQSASSLLPQLDGHWSVLERRE
ncbi:MAG: RnfABCDGE type electron transport complex subunit G [Halorhodospira sp.]